MTTAYITSDGKLPVYAKAREKAYRSLAEWEADPQRAGNVVCCSVADDQVVTVGDESCTFQKSEGSISITVPKEHRHSS
jgi:hypothetical protein